MSSVTINQEFILNVNVDYQGKQDTLEFKMDFSMFDSNDLAVPEFDNTLTLNSKTSLVIDESDFDDLKHDLDLAFSQNHSSKFKDGDSIEMNAKFFDHGMWDIDFVEVGSIG